MLRLGCRVAGRSICRQKPSVIEKLSVQMLRPYINSAYPKLQSLIGILVDFNFGSLWLIIFQVAIQSLIGILVDFRCG